MTKSETELELMEREVAAQEKAANKSNPLTVGVIIAAIGFAGNGFLENLNRKHETNTLKLNAENARVLEALKAESVEKVVENLKFLLEVNLVTDADTIASINSYLNKPEAKRSKPLINTTRFIQAIDPNFLPLSN